MKIITTIETRMSSSRLPGKVLRPILGKPMLQLLIERVKRARRINQIIIATSTQKEDDAIAKLASRLKVECYRGSLKDVMGRVLNAAIAYNADLIVKLSGDNPLYDWEIIDAIVEFYLQNSYDFVSNTAMGFSENWQDERTFPLGTGVSVFSTKLLSKVEVATRAKPFYREHLICYIIQHPEWFKLGAFQAKMDFAAYNKPELCFTVDTEEDFDFIEKIFQGLYPQNPHFSTAEVISFLGKSQELQSINKRIKRKGLERIKGIIQCQRKIERN